MNFLLTHLIQIMLGKVGICIHYTEEDTKVHGNYMLQTTKQTSTEKEIKLGFKMLYLYLETSECTL